jgi:hypothetical protein
VVSILSVRFLLKIEGLSPVAANSVLAVQCPKDVPIVLAAPFTREMQSRGPKNPISSVACVYHKEVNRLEKEKGNFFIQ